MSSSKPLSWKQLLAAVVIGAGLGLLLVLMLMVIVSNTPVEVSPRATRLMLSLAIGFGAFAGLALESVRQLQADNPDPAYHPRSRQRGDRHTKF